MNANQTSEAVLDIVRKSNLNFKIEESPFTLTITIRKSFIKNKNGALRTSGLESSCSTVLQENPAPFPMNQNFENIHSKSKNPCFTTNSPVQKDSISPSSNKYCKPFMPRTTNNRKQQQHPIYPIDQRAIIKPSKCYNKLSSPPSLQPNTYPLRNHGILSKEVNQTSVSLKQPSLLPHNFNHHKFQHQDSFSNSVQHLSPMTKTFPQQRPDQLMSEPFSYGHQDTYPLNWLKNQPTPSSTTPLYSKGGSSTSSSPSRSTSSRARTTMASTWEYFPFKYHPAGLDDDTDPNFSDEELDADELLKKLMIRYNIK